MPAGPPATDRPLCGVLRNWRPSAFSSSWSSVMAYIARLARRLARLRASGPAYLCSMLSLLLIAGCAAGDPTSVGDVTDTPEILDPPLVVNPRRVTLEGTQRALFRAFETDLTTAVTSIEWTATGGSISGDG